MSQQNQADTSENFTENIEATIDDLFTPVKEIEIDPLTNEVKDRATVPQDADTPAEGKAATVTKDAEPAPVTPAEVEAESPGVQSETTDAQAEEGGGFLDLELELDVDFGAKEETRSEGGGKEPEGSSADAQGEEDIIEKFSEAIMSLEWEIKDETISDALTQAEVLKQEYSQHQGTGIMELIGLMISLLSQMTEEPDRFPSVPTALKKAADALQQGIKNPDDTEAAKTAVQELERIAGQETGTPSEPVADETATEPEIELEPLSIQEENQQESGKSADTAQTETKAGEEAASPSSDKHETLAETEAASPLPEEDQATEEFELEILEEPESAAAEAKESSEETAEMAETEAETPVEEISARPEETPSPVAHEPAESSEGVEPEPALIPEVPPPASHKAPPSTPPASELQHTESDGMLLEQNELLKNTIQQHIKELEALNAKIVPVEKLLSRTQGMEKLHAFQKGIRSALEKQRENLAAAIQGNLSDLADSQKELVHEEKPAPSPVTAPASPVGECPWNSMAVMNLGTVKIAVPAEEVAFAGTVSGRFNKKLHKESDFALSWLKPWPWIKIKPSLSGPLGELEEKALKEMKLPVLNSRVSKALDTQDTWEEIKNPAVVILYTSDGEAGVLYVENTPEITEVEEAEWTESSTEARPVAGKIRQADDTMTVISLAAQA